MGERVISRVSFVVFVAVLVLAVAPSRANGPALDPQLAEQGWKLQEFNDLPPTRFALTGDGAIEAVGADSVSTIYREIEGVSLDETPILRWRWRVEESVPPTDLTRKNNDDRNMALYIGFPAVKEHTSFAQRLKLAAARRLAGLEVPGFVLIYTWGGEHPDGTVNENPYFDDLGRQHILRNAATATGQWFEERVNVAQDFVDAFGFEAPDPNYIALSADSDSTDSRVRSLIDIGGFVPNEE